MYRKKLMKKPDFKVDTRPTISYEPILDRHLECYFASRQKRRLLRENRIINRKGEIIDRGLSKKLERGELTLQNSFKSKNKKVVKRKKTLDQEFSLPEKYDSLRPRTVEKDEFQSYLNRQK